MSLRVLRFVAVGVALLSLCACAFQRSEDAAAAKTKMIGMKKEDVLACMGVPGKKAKVAETEVWYYRSSDGSATGSSAWQKSGTFGVAAGEHSRNSCDINIVMKDDKVTRVHYTGPTGGWMVSDEQCGYAVEHCVHND